MDEQEAIREPRLWRDNGWTAKVVKNEDDDGWAVAMTPDGQVEPALVGPLDHGAATRRIRSRWAPRPSIHQWCLRLTESMVNWRIIPSDEPLA